MCTFHTSALSHRTHFERHYRHRCQLLLCGSTARVTVVVDVVVIYLFRPTHMHTPTHPHTSDVCTPCTVRRNYVLRFDHVIVWVFIVVSCCIFFPSSVFPYRYFPLYILLYTYITSNWYDKFVFRFAHLSIQRVSYVYGKRWQ